LKNTLLFGNGLNLLSENPLTWDSLLKKLEVGNNTISNDTPNTMKYEKIFLDRHSIKSNKSKDEELAIKEQIATLMKEQRGNRYYSEIIDLGFQNYLTTNYDNAFCEKYGGEQSNKSTEGIYSLRRYLTLSSKVHSDTKLWHIHGEVEHPKSIMLGLDHYCGSISKIDSYIKGNYEFSVKSAKQKVKPIVDKLKERSFDQISWVELLFNSDVHIVGLSLDYSETDLWWVLNKRARLIHSTNIYNKIYYYDSNINDSKKSLLESMGVTVINVLRNGNNDNDFLVAHHLLTEKLKSNVRNLNTIAA
jgi:hypothetical protein